MYGERMRAAGGLWKWKWKTVLQLAAEGGVRRWVQQQQQQQQQQQ